MIDPRFFERAGPFSLVELSTLCDAEIARGAEDASFSDVAPLQSASAEHVSFLENKLYVDAFCESNAGVCIVAPKFVERAPDGMALLVTEEPYRAYARVAQAFYPKSCYAHAPDAGVHDGAHVADTATLGEGCRIEAGAVVSSGAEIASGVTVGANAYIGPAVIVGEGTWIGPNVTVQAAIIGARCVIHPGARIGQDGFGFAPGREHLKVPQLGRVLVEDDVEIGANTCIDRGTGPDTIIRRGTKLDNFVQIAHNVEVGMGCLFAAHVGISGSAKIGNYVMMGGQTGVAGHLSVGDGVQVVAQSGIIRDVEPGQTVGGSPAIPVKEFWRQIAALKKLVNSKKGA